MRPIVTIAAAALVVTLGVGAAPARGHPLGGHPVTGATTALGGSTGQGGGSPQTPLGGSTCPTARYGPQFYAPGVRGGGKTVALTFDDGPGPSTPKILSILRSFGVRASFFNIGVNETEWPNEVRAEAEDGFLVGNHTWDHPVMTTLSPAAQAAELDRVIHEQRALAGSWPCTFRPPYGDYDAGLLRLAQARHLAVWLWSVDTEDWKAQGSGSAYWVQRIISLAESEGGALEHPVVLMHNQSIPMPATVAALPTVIEYFKAHGYTFVDLLGRTGPPGSCGTLPASFAPPPSTVLRAGATLESGRSLVTPGGQYGLRMRTDGDLVLVVGGGRVLWSSGTSLRGSRLQMRRDGDLAVTSPSGATLWSSRTSGHPGARLKVQANGDLVVASGARTLWDTATTQSTLTPGERLRTGWYLESPDHACRLLLQRDGDLVLYSAQRQVLWSSGTGGFPGATAVLERGGALELRSSSWQPIFSTGGTGRTPAVLTLARRSQVVLLTAKGSILWSSG